MYYQEALSITSNDLFTKYSDKKDGKYIYFDETIDSIVIDIEDIRDFNEMDRFRFLTSEVDEEAFLYHAILISKE